jgi:hypothetical protein
MKENKGGMTMKGLTLSLGMAALACLPMSGMAQEAATDSAVPPIYYQYQIVDYPNDVFTQLLGINDTGLIAGYHGSGNPGHPNRGFTLDLPLSFTSENVPGAVQTQVIGINNANNTSGFYIDQAGANHGFLKINGHFYDPVDFPATTSSPAVNQLLGLNTHGQSAGFYNDSAGNSHGYVYAQYGKVFSVFTIPGAVSAAVTGVNESGQVCGFYTDTIGHTHGFFLIGGHFNILNFPNSTFTQAFGLNNNAQVVGTYTDLSGMIHGFIWTAGVGFAGPLDNTASPSGVGATIVNGINDGGVIVGFSGVCVSAPMGAATCDGFVAFP